MLVVSSVSAWNDYKKEEQFLKLNALSESKNTVAVHRDGQEREINVNDIKVGDLVRIRAGMEIPCDGIVINGTGITTNESAMTGESVELKKDPLHLCLIKQEEKEEE